MAARLVFVANAPIDSTRAATFPTPDSAVVGRVEPAPIRMVGCLRGSEQRCAQTASGLGWPAEVDPALDDLDLGAWAGADPMDLLMAGTPELADFFRRPTVRPPGGETVSELIARVGRRCDGDWPDGRTVLVTSPAVVRAAVVHLLGLPESAYFNFDVAPLDALSCSRSDARWTMRSLMPFAAWSALWARDESA
ncbi:Histidine phosphatase superfamily (branch 1) [Nakamurella panacisegetis]|uniref:Histidine phosphatase superfamily (Branch 1) n=1 Tax=Nakamurella panacisegetis TaxID=1090615 RepID=A0A1H0HYR4_9ACTN|nr:histidine phosphatase family protein [Nakamurella panacisegetis]SDO24386.1 Histidine phosphatase superfamily (branch 1) [Nakamurella panacisegetis]